MIKSKARGQGEAITSMVGRLESLADMLRCAADESIAVDVREIAESIQAALDGERVPLLKSGNPTCEAVCAAVIATDDAKRAAARAAAK